jgi:hypothetical protein
VLHPSTAIVVDVVRQPSMSCKNVQWLALAMLLCAIVATAAEEEPAATIAGKYGRSAYDKPPSDTYYDKDDGYRGGSGKYKYVEQLGLAKLFVKYSRI